MDMTPRQSPWFSEDPQKQNSIPFPGIVRMVIPCEPWKLALSLHAMEISKQWIRAEIDRKSFEKKFSFDDLPLIFRLDEFYGLQLEPDNKHLPTPMISSELTSRDVHSNGIQLQFTFLNSPPELDELLLELSAAASYIMN